MKKTLGEFEHLVLLAILQLGEDAYGAAIVDELEARTGREVSQAATYIALRRLRAKGAVTALDGDPVADRGGRPRRYFSLTDDGLARLRESGTALFRMWSGLERLLDQKP